MFISNFFRLPYLFYKVFTLCHYEKHSIEERYGFLHHFVVGANKGGRVKVEVSGLENLPKEQGYIIFPNHQGFYDVLSILEANPKPFSVVAKKETQKHILLKKVLLVLNAEFIDREDIRQSLTVINNMTARVLAGENFVIFPEGTRSKMGNKLGPFKGGSFKSAMNAKCPIVPAALINSFVPFDEPSIRKTTVYLHYFKPLYYEDYKGMKSTELALLVHDKIQDYIDNEVVRL